MDSLDCSEGIKHMTPQDQIIGALCAWRENRGGIPQPDAMQSILNVLQNRAAKHGTDIYTEATRKLQFSSLTAPGNPELTLWPSDNDPQWVMALGMAQEIANGTLFDLTRGATDYYAPRGIVTKLGKIFTTPDGTAYPFPDGWNESAVTYTRTIGNQLFFTE